MKNLYKKDITEELYKMLKYNQESSPDKKMCLLVRGCFKYDSYIKDFEIIHNLNYDQIIIKDDKIEFIIDIRNIDIKFIILSDNLFFNFEKQMCIEIY